MDEEAQAEEFRYEVVFHTGAAAQTVAAARTEDVDGWTYFHTRDGGWALKVQSPLIQHITRGRPATGMAASPARE